MTLCHTFKLCIVITLITLTLSTTKNNSDARPDRPNIVIILADDMGFDDVSFRGSNEFLTPNIDALAYSGMILNHYYVPSMCTPSRAALLTGKYPINTGMQHYVIPNDQPWALPLNERTIAEIFREAGYHTSLIGKWHLGLSRLKYTPTKRGFDHHFGYLGSYIDYYEHNLYSKPYARGHDLRRNLNVSHQEIGQYATDLFTDEAVLLITNHTKEQPIFMIVSHLAPHAANDEDPLQAPQSEIDKFAYIASAERRTYAAMLSKLDESVGKIVDALHIKGILNNTILIFYSDNGGPTEGMHANSASNYPLRGQKNTPWEGGVRTAAAIWSPKLQRRGIVWNQTVYAGDWLPTLAAAAQIDLSAASNHDGLNLWPQIINGSPPVDREIVHNIDDIVKYVSYFKGRWKYINGTTEDGIYDGWLGKRSNGNSTAVDPRASDYVKEIQKTSVWRRLSLLSNRSEQIGIAELRQQCTIRCYPSTFGYEPKRCDPLLNECLFDLSLDPCEQNNLYEQFKDSAMLNEIRRDVERFRQNAKTPANRPTDPKCNPKFFNNEWTWWEDEAEFSKNYASSSRSLVTIIVLNHLIIILYVWVVNYIQF